MLWRFKSKNFMDKKKKWDNNLRSDFYGQRILKLVTVTGRCVTVYYGDKCISHRTDGKILDGRRL
jgi:hypothetical protein